MKKMERCGALAVVFFALALVGCGGQTSSASSETISGVSTPSTLSVVTAKNAD